MRQRRDLVKADFRSIFSCLLHIITFGLYQRTDSFDNSLILNENDDENPVTTPIQPSRPFDINNIKNEVAKVWIPYRHDLVSKIIYEQPGELQSRNIELTNVLARYSSHFILQQHNKIDLFLRPLLPTDARKLKISIQNHDVSSNSLFLRFNRPIHDVPDELLTYLTNIDYDYHYAVSAGFVVDGKWEICGMARFIQERNDPEMAEWSALVVDKYHGNRIGSCMLYYLSQIAFQHGIRHFYAIVNPRNTTVLHWMKKLQGRMMQYNGVHVWTFDIPIYTEWITDPQVKYELDKSAAGTNIIDDKYKHIIHTEIQNIKDLPIYNI